MKAYTLAQLAWIKAVGCFWGDARKRMLELGISEYSAFVLTGESFRKGDLVQLYWDSGAEHGADLELYLDDVLKSYPTGWPHQKAVSYDT
jgi:hypothetical protein